MLTSPISSYHIYKNGMTGQIQVFYDDKNIRDEEKIYTFNPDGSASVRSCAWGRMSMCPKGSFSDILLKLPNVEKLNSEIAKDLTIKYHEYEKKHNISSSVINK